MLFSAKHHLGYTHGDTFESFQRSVSTLFVPRDRRGRVGADPEAGGGRLTQSAESAAAKWVVPCFKSQATASQSKSGGG